MLNRHESRLIAVQAMYSWELNPVSKAEEVDLSWIDEPVSDEDLLFSRFLLKGTIDNIEEIDGLIKKNIKNWPFERLSKVVLSILRLSIYSILYQKEIPINITIDEAVNLSKELCKEDSYRFINGVLDSIYRTRK